MRKSKIIGQTVFYTANIQLKFSEKKNALVSLENLSFLRRGFYSKNITRIESKICKEEQKQMLIIYLDARLYHVTRFY